MCGEVGWGVGGILEPTAPFFKNSDPKELEIGTPWSDAITALLILFSISVVFESSILSRIFFFERTLFRRLISFLGGA